MEKHNGQIINCSCVSVLHLPFRLHQTAMAMLSSRFVSFSLCLLATLRENAGTDFHEIFRICWARYVEQSLIFGGGMFNPFHTCFRFIFFQCNPCLWATLLKKRMKRFSWFFLGKMGNDTRSNLEHFRNNAANPLIWHRFLYFLDPYP